MKKMLVFVALLLLLLSPVFAAGSQEVVEEVAAADSQFAGLASIDYAEWEIGETGGSIVVGQISDPKTFNGVVASETSSTDVTDMTESGAIARDQLTLEFVPAMAEGWTVSDDEKTVTVTIKKGLKWSDGVAITAKDFVFAVNQLILRQSVGSNSRSGYFIPTEIDGEYIELPAKVTLVDDYTYTFELPEVYAGLVGLAGIVPYPIHVFAPLIGWDESKGWDYDYTVEKVKDDEGNEYLDVIETEVAGIDYSAVTSFWGVDADVTEIVASGPFVLKEYVPAQKVVFGRNPNYWEKDAAGTQLPYLDEVVYVIVEDQNTQKAKFESGELDIFGLRGEDVDTFVGKKAELNIELYSAGPVASTQFIVFNQGPEATYTEGADYWSNNKQFRQAMAYVVDRQTIIDNIAYGFGYPQYSFVPKFSPYFWEGVEDAAFKYNLEKAKTMLDDLGWTDTDGDGIREDDKGNKISMAMTTNSGNTVREQIGQLFAQDALKVGIEINFQPEDFNTMVGKLLSGNDWDCILIGLTGSVDPISGANVYPSNGNLHMIEPNQKTPRRDWEKDVDAAWVVANNTTNEDQRKAGYETLQKIWADEVPWIYTFNAASVQAYSQNYGNVKPRPIDGFGFKGIANRLYVK